MVRSPEEDLCGKVPAQLAAERAIDGDGLEWKFLPTGRHITTASLACHHEGLPISGHLEHAIIIGRYITNLVSTNTLRFRAETVEESQQ